MQYYTALTARTDHCLQHTHTYIFRTIVIGVSVQTEIKSAMKQCLTETFLAL